jgi:hypothetical protein
VKSRSPVVVYLTFVVIEGQDRTAPQGRLLKRLVRLPVWFTRMYSFGALLRSCSSIRFSAWCFGAIAIELFNIVADCDNTIFEV